MGSNAECAAMPPPPMVPLTTDTSSNMINATQNTQVSDMHTGAIILSQEGMDNQAPIPSMTYASSSSELSSVSSISAHEGFSSTVIATGDIPNIESKEYNLPPTKSGLSLKYPNSLTGWRNIAPAPSPAAVLSPSITATTTTAAAATATIGAVGNAEGAEVPLASTPKTSPSKPAPQRRRTMGSAKSRNTRKSGRHDDDEGVIKAEDSDSDESSDAQLTTTQTKSGRQIHRPTMFTPEQNQPKSASPDASQQQQQPPPPRKRRRVYRKGKEANVVCLRCDRGHSPKCNAIVFCDECNAPWHQFCHDPPIGEDVISVKKMEWFCRECRPVDAPLDPALQANEQLGFTRLHPSTSPSMLTSAPQTPLLGSSQFSKAEKKSYLSSLSHAALVNLLVNISESRPDIPIFPANLNELNASSFNSDNSTTASANNLNGSATISQQNKISRHVTASATLTPISSKRPFESVPASTSNGDSNENDGGFSDGEQVEEHRLYPRPGNGFRLPPDTEDLDVLLEDPSSTTFSHALHGPAAEANRLQMVGGIA
ncbi:hypothetical protein MauCBS54593_002280 [Microsporum audouinii]